MNPTSRSIATLLAILSFGLDASAGKIEEVSVPVGAGGANGYCESSSISGSGRIVTFGSAASNLVAGDTNGFADVFVRDRKKNVTVRVSVDSAGNEAHGDSSFPAVSASGRFVAFESSATDLVDGDTNGASDVFVHDRKKKTTTRVSVATGGGQADGPSFAPSISANGRYVAFVCYGTNVVLDDTNGTADVMVHDRKKGITTRVSIATGGAQADGGFCFSPSISANGRYVAFISNHIDLISGDPTTTNNVFVHDRKQGATTRVSVDAAGMQPNGLCWSPSISANGRFVAFESKGSNLADGDTNGVSDVFLRDRKAGVTTLVSRRRDGAPGNGSSALPALSANGRFIAFATDANDLLDEDGNGARDVLVFDRKKKTTKAVSADEAGALGNGFSNRPAISGKGKHVAFESTAQLVASGSGGLGIYVRTRKP